MGGDRSTHIPLLPFDSAVLPKSLGHLHSPTKMPSRELLDAVFPETETHADSRSWMPSPLSVTVLLATVAPFESWIRIPCPSALMTWLPSTCAPSESHTSI